MTRDPEDIADERKHWRDKALCAQIGGDLWFPEKGERQAATRAKGMCQTCPVIAQCLEYAVGNPAIQHGIWGGEAPKDIRRIRRERSLEGAELPEGIEPEDESIYG